MAIVTPIIYPTYNFNFLEEDRSFKKEFEEKSNTLKISMLPNKRKFKSSARKQKKGSRK